MKRNSSSGTTEETPAKRRNQATTRTQQKPTVAADGSGDVFPRELPEGYTQSFSLTRVRTVGFGPRPRGATAGDWTFGSSPHPRKCSLTCLQGPDEMEPNIPEGVGRTLRSAISKTITFGAKGITFCRPKVTDGCPETQAQRPIPSVAKDIAFARPKVTNGCSEAQVRRPGPSGQGINFGSEGSG